MNREKKWASSISEMYSDIANSNCGSHIAMECSFLFKKKKNFDIVFKPLTQFQYHITEYIENKKIVKQYESLFLSL
ncbi:MAG: hypothetical protein BM564_12050 [Bacteroidetes bacterium MedPE-SWsnd-G2]|nr:MAG: hypothetical protein BM564_12050 [Bacteroidetes bacterium MedPE-SWsnd-G2]